MYLTELLFCDKRKFKRFHTYGLNNTKRIKKKQVTLILYSVTPSDMNFQTILMPKVILAIFFVTKIYSLGPFLS